MIQRRISDVSIIIPVYNEAEQLAACLAAIARQHLAPREVIVVDNNSTDGSAAIASGYDFVTVVREPRQGVVHARNRGFNLARGQIIGRIDADTLLPPDWTAEVEAIFTDQTVAAVSGSAHYYDFALDQLADSVDGYFRNRLSRRLKTANFLWGANMAVRRSAWQAVKQQLCNRSGLHEDFDLGLHLQAGGHKVAYDPRLQASVSSRRISMSFAEYVRYSLISPRTYAEHGLSCQRHMYPALAVCWLTYLPAHLIYKGYDADQQRFVWSRLLTPAIARVDPTTNVV